MRKQFGICLTREAEKIGLAVMLKDLLTQNLEQKPGKIHDFQKLSIEIALNVPDADIELLMKFSNGILAIDKGVAGSTPGLVITSNADSVLALSNVRIRCGLPYYFDGPGKEVLQAMGKGGIKIKGMFKHFLSLVRLSRIMSVR